MGEFLTKILGIRRGGFTVRISELEKHTVKAFPSGEGAAQRMRRAADEESGFQSTFLVSVFPLPINENSQPEGFCMRLSSSTAIAVPLPRWGRL